MRVLHVIDSLAFGGGAEESLVGMLPRLRERGIDGDVICLYDRAGHQDSLRADDFSVDVLSNTSLWMRALAIRRAIRSKKPDLVHSSLIDANLATRIAMIGLRTPQLNSLVNTTYDPVRVSDLGIASWKIAALRLIDRFTSRWVTPGFHALTEAVKEEATNVLRIPSNKVWVIPRGRASEQMGKPTPARRERVRASLGMSKDHVMILNVGRQEPQKAKPLLVEAFTRIAADHLEAHLFIAGKKGKDTEALTAAIKESNVQERIHVLGHRSDVADLLCAADLFVFPSLYEGLGGSLVEAMCMGCPTIGSDAPAVREVLGGGAHGLVVPRGDEEALAKAMSQLVGSEELRAEWGRRGREHFDQTFELDNVIDELASLYGRLS